MNYFIFVTKVQAMYLCHKQKEMRWWPLEKSERNNVAFKFPKWVEFNERNDGI